MSDEPQDAQDKPVPPRMMLIHKPSGHGGVVDAEAEHPDGMVIVRVNDQWFPLDDCEEWEPK